MKKKLTILILFFFSNFLGKAQSIIIEGTLENGVSDTIFIHHDPLFLNENVQIIPQVVGADKHFSFTFYIANRSIVNLVYKGQRLPIFVNPDDRVELKSDAKNFLKSAVFSEKNSKENNFLKAFNEKFASDFASKTQYESIQNQTIDACEMKLFEAKKAKVKFYNEHPDKNSLNESFKKYIENEIRFNYWHLLLAQPILKGNANPKLPQVLSLPPSYLTNLDENKIKDENAMLSSEYRAFLNYYVTYFNSKEKGFVKYADMSKMVKDKHQFAREHLQGQAYQYYLAFLANERYQQILPSVLRNTFEAISITPKSEDYIATLRPKFAATMLKTDEEVLRANKPDNFLRFQDIKGDTISMKQFLGKVVYLDIWASWCGPCRMEFPHSRTLHESFSEKEKKNIVFLYISIDDNLENWKKAMEILKLDNGFNGVSIGGWNSKIAKHFKVNSIPRYILINKDGNVVAENAQRPSSGEEIKSQILKLLNEK